MVDAATRGNLRIRRAVSFDTASISSILFESFIELQPQYTQEGFWATACSPDHILARLEEGPIWVVLLNENMVGTVSVVARGQELYLRGMAVIPSARGSHIGRKMLQHIEQYAAKNGFAYLTLATTPFLTRAIQLYEHYGFQRISDEPEDYFGTPIYTMKKTVEATG
jgi:ribosomal protein S18 acetylase RimI-like enzyme